jgi:hypothetical protein
VVEYSFATIESTSCYSIPDLISVSTLTNHHIGMQKYHSNCTSQTNRFDHAGTTCLFFDTEPSYAFDSIQAILATTFEKVHLEAYSWEQSTVPSPWNMYSTDSARVGGGLAINDAVFALNWTLYSGAKSSFSCDPEELSACEAHN